MSCQNIGGAIICSGGPQEMIHDESVGERWCFHCRARRDFRYQVWADVKPSYYPPTPSIRCVHCDALDGDLFPGRAREWDE